MRYAVALNIAIMPNKSLYALRAARRAPTAGIASIYAIGNVLASSTRSFCRTENEAGSGAEHAAFRPDGHYKEGQGANQRDRWHGAIKEGRGAKLIPASNGVPITAAPDVASATPVCVNARSRSVAARLGVKLLI